ncbi:Di-copper centre-containing protein [Martensiomyces pterosporus]|nr:Di-copper centre-containing protein [Martensiomyces pterosporus]
MNSDGQFDRFASTHQNVFGNVHGKSAFFPFHRRFVLEFENLGRQIDANFTIPYWDTTREYRNPASSPILQEDTLGGNGEGPGSCLTTGIQANWEMGFPSQHCLRRRFTMQPWAPPELISSFIQRDRVLADFREHIEFSIHGSAHIGLGGDAATPYAPTDFFFQMHHANLDRLWWVWQNAQGDIFNYNGPGQHGQEATLDDQIPQDDAVDFGNAPVRSVMVLGYNGVCYAYDSAPPPPTRYPSDAPDRLSNLGSHWQPLESEQTVRVLHTPSSPPTKRRKIAYPGRLSHAWIKMHGFDPIRVEEFHREMCHLVALLNNSTYVSPY